MQRIMGNGKISKTQVLPFPIRNLLLLFVNNLTVQFKHNNKNIIKWISSVYFSCALKLAIHALTRISIKNAVQSALLNTQMCGNKWQHCQHLTFLYVQKREEINASKLATKKLRFVFNSYICVLCVWKLWIYIMEIIN